jgi:anaerobic ribonucleoside-triphosphate reductase activating protein
VPALADLIRRGTPNRRLTISGGEPLEQVDAVRALLKELPDFDIVLYTGMEEDDVPEDVLARVQYLKVGPYRAELSHTMLPFVGSSNQRFLQTGQQEGRRNEGA